jgi:hypothetical protein
VITTVEELEILLRVAADEGTTEAFKTIWDRATSEIAAELREAIAAERVRRGQRVEP